MQLEAPGFPARGGGEARGHHEGAPEIAASSLATGGDLLAGHGRRPPRGPRAAAASRATGSTRHRARSPTSPWRPPGPVPPYNRSSLGVPSQKPSVLQSRAERRQRCRQVRSRSCARPSWFSKRAPPAGPVPPCALPAPCPRAPPPAPCPRAGLRGPAPLVAGPAGAESSFSTAPRWLETR